MQRQPSRRTADQRDGDAGSTPAAVVRHEVVAVDTAAAEESIRAVVPRARIAGGADVRHRMRFDGDERFTVGHLEWSGELTGGEPDGSADAFTVVRPTSGGVDWEVGHESGAGSAPWIQSPGLPTFFRFGPLTQNAVFLRAAPLAAMGRILYGEDGFHPAFDGAAPVNSGAAAWVGAVVDHAAAIAPTDLFDSPLIRVAVYRSLALAVFGGFRLSGDQAHRRTVAEHRRRLYENAREFLDDRASSSVTADDAAAAVGVSTVELHDLFRTHSPSETTATGYLRRVRYTSAHDELVSGDPTLGDTVRDIATRWGFANLSRFASGYREIYGVTPKWTLDR